MVYNGKWGGGLLNSERIKMLRASGIFIVCILLYNMFSIYIEYFIGTFVVMILFLTVGFLLGMIILSIIKIFVDKQYRFSIYILASVIALCLITSQTFRFVGLAIDFNSNKNERLKVADMLKSGAIAVNPMEEYVQLPSKYAYLSRNDGKVMVYEAEGSIKTCFFASGGLYRKHDVVVYISNNDDLANGDFGERISNIKKLENNWFSGKIVK
ncbi:MAG: hypothetical protein K0R09_2721 [Clostridiales bacterium]|jgi:hypothetical protein|nr:hypothetical protein [Clostridiales bacterium]